MGPKTQFSDNLHATKYRGVGEDFRESKNREAFGLKDDDQHYHQIREITLDLRFLFGGRIQGSIGASRRTTAFNCYVSGTIDDSLIGPGGIMTRLHEAAATLKLGGGIGYDFSTLRPRGAPVKTIQTHASGPVSFMDFFNTVGNGVCSSGHRFGAQMGVMRVDHPDIEEFVLVKQNNNKLTGFNISIAVTDEFMEAVINEKPFMLTFKGEVYKTVDAAALWERIMRSTWDFAEPGVLFIDTVNRMNNLWYCEKIAATNPCFTADTKVWTDLGSKTFAELVGSEVNVLTNKDGRFVYRKMKNIRKTQSQAKLVEIQLRASNGIVSKITCTPSHKFYLKNGLEVNADQLNPGDRLASVYRRPRGNKGYIGLYSSSHDGMMEHHVPFEEIKGLGIDVDVHHLDENKKNNSPSNLELRSHDEHASHHFSGDNNPMRKFPEKNHFHVMNVAGNNNPSWRDDVDTEQLSALRESGFSFAAIAKQVGCSKYTVMQRLGWERPNHVVVSISEICRREDVYCGEVEDTHTFYITTGGDDGVLVHNCGEQPLPPFGACLLGSFNMTRYLRLGAPVRLVDPNEPPEVILNRYYFDWDQFKADIPVIVRAMDNVIDRTTYPLAEQRAESFSKRRMGLGITGLANAAEAMGFPYGSPGFVEFEEKVLQTLRDESYLASSRIAGEKGAFPLFDAERYLRGPFIETLPEEIRYSIRKRGMRNSHMTSIAPTGTISLCADNISSSIEPVFAYDTKRKIKLPNGDQEVIVSDYGKEFLGTRGKLAKDVTAAEHLEVLSTAQKYVDSAVSKTINMDGRTMLWPAFQSIYRTAWENLCKGCTTFNSSGMRGALLQEQPEGGTCTVDPETGRRDCA